jgi:acyl-CoA synthetase (AMP-forming)/AMP-acid ligase II
VDDSGNDCVEDCQVGEIYIKPPFPMLGYLNDPAATSEAFASGGWIRSGDIGYVKDAKWYVPDRKKDIVKVRGWQVSPTELECVLLLHEDIVDAGVVGIQAANTSDEVPRGFAVRRPGSTITEYDARVWMSERLARYKQVDRVIFITEIPRNPTGKILRRALREGKYNEDTAASGVATIQVSPPEVVTEEVVVTDDGCSSRGSTGEIHSILTDIINLHVTEEDTTM